MKRRNQTSKRTYRAHTLISFLATAMILTVFAARAHSAEVTLQWNSVSGAEGYKVYYGTTSRTYQSPTDVGDQTTHTLTLDPDTYFFAVTAYNSYGESGYSDEVGPTTITGSNPPTSVSLSPDLASPQSEGTPVTFTAQAEGGSENYEYQFFLCDPDSQWSMVQDYSSSPNYTWTVLSGTSRIQVVARNVGSEETYQVERTITYRSTPSPGSITDVSLISDPPNPQTVGTQITFTAQATGGSGDYEYAFCRFNGYWHPLRDYSPSPTYTWNVTPGGCAIVVFARTAGSKLDYEAYNAVFINPVTANLISDLPSPQPAGTQVTFTAQATGGSGDYEYAFCRFNGYWHPLRDYSPSPTYTWNATNGGCAIVVFVRTAGSSVHYEAYDSMLFSIE